MNSREPGTILDDKYEIVQRLGSGGMGEVYLVRHVHLQELRVIKILRQDLAADPVAQKRFVREARLATQIKHPNVAILYDFSRLPDGSFYMVWEHIQGQDVGDWLRQRGPFPVPAAIRLGIQALRGLGAIHTAGIVHRDLSPDNLMIMENNRQQAWLKIIDLGLAKNLAAPDGGLEITQVGMFMGKLQYCSPEQAGAASGEALDSRTDIYSFALVLYEMVTGLPPFESDSPHGFIFKRLSEDPLPMAGRNPHVEVPVELDQVVRRALQRDREQRFPDTVSFIVALEQVEKGLHKVETREVVLPPEARAGRLPAAAVAPAPAVRQRSSSELSRAEKIDLLAQIERAAKRVSESSVDLARAEGAIAAGRFADAHRLLAQIEAANPRSPGLDALKHRLAAAEAAIGATPLPWSLSPAAAPAAPSRVAGPDPGAAASPAAGSGTADALPHVGPRPVAAPRSAAPPLAAPSRAAAAPDSMAALVAELAAASAPAHSAPAAGPVPALAPAGSAVPPRAATPSSGAILPASPAAYRASAAAPARPDPAAAVAPGPAVPEWGAPPPIAAPAQARPVAAADVPGPAVPVWGAAPPVAAPAQAWPVAAPEASGQGLPAWGVAPPAAAPAQAWSVAAPEAPAPPRAPMEEPPARQSPVQDPAPGDPGEEPPVEEPPSPAEPPPAEEPPMEEPPVGEPRRATAGESATAAAAADSRERVAEAERVLRRYLERKQLPLASLALETLLELAPRHPNRGDYESWVNLLGEEVDQERRADVALAAGRAAITRRDFAAARRELEVVARNDLAGKRAEALAAELDEVETATRQGLEFEEHKKRLTELLAAHKLDQAEAEIKELAALGLSNVTLDSFSARLREARAVVDQERLAAPLEKRYRERLQARDWFGAREVILELERAAPAGTRAAVMYSEIERLEAIHRRQQAADQGVQQVDAFLEKGDLANAELAFRVLLKVDPENRHRKRIERQLRASRS